MKECAYSPSAPKPFGPVSWRKSSPRDLTASIVTASADMIIATSWSLPACDSS